MQSLYSLNPPNRRPIPTRFLFGFQDFWDFNLGFLRKCTRFLMVSDPSLNTNIWTNLTKEFSSEVTYFIMANRWKAATRTTESMFNIKRFATHTQDSGRRASCHPNLKHKASRNSPFGMANPCSAIGRVVNQYEAPRSEAASNERLKEGERHSGKDLAKVIKSLRQEAPTSRLL